jgi:hypothetical protein
MIVARPNTAKEPDLLTGHESEALRYVAMDGQELATIPAPASGWTHDALERVRPAIPEGEAWDAFLGTQWVGRSEL